jgi:RHS repeat-associated protein
VYTYGHALLSQQQFVQGAWQRSFYGQDGHGSVRFLTDSHSFVTDSYDYDAFGNLLARSGTTPNRYLFTSEQYDYDLNLYYLRARYHDPQRGRFWSQDSFEGFGSDPTSLHKYTYCGNNPVNQVDPSGNMGVFQSVFTVQSGLLARVAQGAVIGGMFGGMLGVGDAILHGRIQTGELVQAANNGIASGMLFGAALGGAAAASAYTGVIALGGDVAQAALLGTASAFGVLSAQESFRGSHYAGGTYRLALALMPFYLPKAFTSLSLLGTMNSEYAQVPALGAKAFELNASWRTRVELGLAGIEEKPAILSAAEAQIVQQQHIRAPRLPIQGGTTSRDCVACVAKAIYESVTGKTDKSFDQLTGFVNENDVTSVSAAVGMIANASKLGYEASPVRWGQVTQPGIYSVFIESNGKGHVVLGRVIQALDGTITRQIQDPQNGQEFIGPSVYDNSSSYLWFEK